MKGDAQGGREAWHREGQRGKGALGVGREGGRVGGESRGDGRKGRRRKKESEKQTGGRERKMSIKNLSA